MRRFPPPFSIRELPRIASWEEKHPKLVEGVMFTTGDTMSGDIQSFLEQTSRPFLPKPFTLDELRMVVRETLKQMER